jgi:hypothetical protein
VTASDRISSQARHYLMVIVVFGITGSIAVTLSRLLLNDLLGLEGSLWAGPWGYRAAYVALIPPSYSLTLVAVGTLFGKRAYFSRRAMRVWGAPVRLVKLVKLIGRDPDR